MPLSPFLIVSGVQGDTRRYRSHHLYEQMRLAGVECRLAHLSDPGLPALAAQAQSVLFQRVAWDRVAEALARPVRAAGGRVLADLDDLVFDEEAFRWIDSPDFADPTRVRLYRETMRRNRLMLEHCDGVLASTDYLASRASACGALTWVHRNAFSLEMLADSNQALAARPGQRELVVIGYASGTPTHDRDFALVRPALQQVLAACPQAELWLLGRLSPGDDWGTLAGRVRTLPFVPWRQLPALLAQLDINLAPLRMDNPFSQSKSEIKYVEAALVGTPTVASPTDAFRYAIRSGQNGLLASSSEEWQEQLCWLVEDPAARQRLSAAARQDVSQRYAPWVRAEQALATLQAAGLALQPAEAPLTPVDPQARRDLWFSPQEERRPTLVQRGLYSLRTRGLATLAGEVWVYLRRLAAPIFPFHPRQTS